MRHPALTRFFSAILAALSAITLISGGICIKKAADDRKKQNNMQLILLEKWEDAVKIDTKLAEMSEEYESMDKDHAELSERYSRDMISFRKDLAIYTATEAGLKQGAAQIEEGYAGLRSGWIAHDNGIRELQAAEAQFQTGYDDFLAGKAALAEAWQKYYLAEEYVNSGADIEQQKTLIQSGANLSRSMADAMAALAATLSDPPIDEETGEIDSASLTLRLTEQSSAILTELAQSEDLRNAAQIAFDSAQGFVRANAATLEDMIRQGYSAEEVQGYIISQGARVQEKLNGMQQLFDELGGAEDTEAKLKEALESLRSDAEQISKGDMSESELVSVVADMLGTMQSVLGDASVMLNGVAEMMNMLEDLPAMRAQLEAGQVAIDESEAVMAKAKEGFAEGYRQLDAAKNMLITAESQLRIGSQALDEKRQEQIETRADLDRRKAELEKDSATLANQSVLLEDYDAKKDHFSNLRFAMLANEGVSSRVHDGEELLAAVEKELDFEHEQTRLQFRYRLAAAIGMITSSLFGIWTVAAGFRDGQGKKLFVPLSAAVLLAAASEGVSFYAGRGMIYTVLFVGLFALGIGLLNVKKA